MSLRVSALVVAVAFASCAQAQLFTENWDDGNGSSRWSGALTAQENSTIAFEGSVDYAFDYSVIGAASAPNSTGGTTTGVFMETNTVESGAVNEGESIGIVPLNFTLPDDDFSLTADVYIFWNNLSGSTEYATFGIGHDGSNNVPFRFGDDLGSTFDGRGFAWQIDSDGDSGTDIIAYEEGFGQTGLGGWEDIPNGDIPGVTTGTPAPTGPFNTWVELSITKENQFVEFAINGFVLDSFDTFGDFSGGTLLIGQSDPFNSVNADDGSGNSNGVVFDNIRVVALGDVPVEPGDFNGDGKVDNGDLNLLLGNWGSPTVPAEWVNGFETPVDNGELNALLGNWGAGVGAAVPEPTAAVLLVAGLVAVARRR